MALNKLINLDDLGDRDRFLNRKAVEVMVKGTTYEFAENVQTIPKERRLLGARKYLQPFVFRRAVYFDFQEDTEEHIFTFTTYRGKVFFLPMFLHGGVTCYPVSDAPVQQKVTHLRLVQ